MKLPDVAYRVSVACVVALATTGCALSSASSPPKWAPVPIYGTGLDASVGATCARATETLPDSIWSAVDILVDSLGTDGLDELPIQVQQRPEWLVNYPEPTFSVTIFYPRRTTGTLRESWHACAVRAGATVRVNAATIGRAAVAIAASGPVRITLRAMDGRLLAAPMILAPGMPRQVVRWRDRSRAT